jgi:hypothetical protein
MHSGAKARKKVRVSGVWMKVLLFLLMLGFIAWQLWSQNWSTITAFQLQHPFLLVLAVVLIVANQGCEWFKWKRVARELNAGKATVRNAFFGGIGAGFMTPNGWGNFMGRMVFFRKRDRLFIVLSSFVSNVSQVLPTVFFGAIACAFSSKVSIPAAGFVLSIGMLILLVFFFGEYLLPSKRSRWKAVRHFQLMQERLGGLRMPLFLWSNLRFLIFSLQYLLLFMAFGYSDHWFLLTHIWLIFLLTSFIPSLWSGKVVIRETAGIFVFTGSAVAIPDVVLVSLLIWLINSVLPALISSFVWIPISKKTFHVVD